MSGLIKYCFKNRVKSVDFNKSDEFKEFETRVLIILDKLKKILALYYPVYNRKYKHNLRSKYDEFKQTAFEDRENDWLAREIKAEKSIERKMDASEMLRQDHLEHHNWEDERPDRP